MAAISKGCGVLSHRLRFLQANFPVTCLDCSSSTRSGDGYYHCDQCGHVLCIKCASRGRTTLNASQVPRSRNPPNPRPPRRISYRRESAQKRATGAAESSRSSPRRSLYEVTDSDVTDSDVTDSDDDDEDKDQLVIACPGLISHELQFLKKPPYQGRSFGCDMCKKAGNSDLYHCETCQFDAHKACAEIEMQVKVFFHKHPLQLNHTDDEEESTCRFCLGDSKEEIGPWIYKCPKCPNFAVHARCAKYTKSLKHSGHPHELNLVQNPAIGDNPDFLCDGCGKSIHQGYHYTCTDQSCDIDLHPFCAICPAQPLCPLNPTHRVNMDYQTIGTEQCVLCDSQADEAEWMYQCIVCDVFMHMDCLNAESSDEELSDISQSDEEDEEIDEFYGRLIESMDDFGNQDDEEQVDKLSELANSFKNHTEAASSLARQRSAKSRVDPQMSTRAQSEIHLIDHGFASMSLGSSSRPEVRRSDAGEEERRTGKQAAKEQRQKEKAAARALKEQKKAARREDEAMRAKALANQLRNFEKELQKIQNHKQSGSNDVSISKDLAQLRASIETWQASAVDRHKEQVKLHQQRHEEYMSGLQEIIRTQVHSTTRAVPRLVLCTETTSKTRKLLTVLRVGLKGVQLHLLCEHAQPHVVAGASGCEINQKVAGDRWTNLQPFLAAGVQIVAMAINFAGMGAGMSAISSVLPDFHKKVWDTQAIDLGKHAMPTSRKKLAPKKETVAEQAAAEWLISYLDNQKINIAESFKLYRVRYLSPDHMKGAVGWLCQEHLDCGMKKHMLERFPVCK